VDKCPQKLLRTMPAGVPCWTARFACCAEAGTELTPLRQQVLLMLFEQGRAMGAYDLSEAYGRASGNVPSLYRVLKFWCDLGLVTYLPGRNAFVLAALLLVCSRCGSVSQHSSASVYSDGVSSCTTCWFQTGSAGHRNPGIVFELFGAQSVNSATIRCKR